MQIGDPRFGGMTDSQKCYVMAEMLTIICKMDLPWEERADFDRLLPEIARLLMWAHHVIRSVERKEQNTGAATEMLDWIRNHMRN